MKSSCRLRRAGLLLLGLISLAVLPSKAGAAPRAPVIVIDPGHGGIADSGSMAARTLSASNNATSTGGVREKALTLELSKLIAERIPAAAAKAGRSDVQVVLTRTGDTNPDFAERSRICAEAGASCIVSIHFNAIGGPRKTLGSLAMVSAEARNPNYALDRRFAEDLTAACNAAVRRFLPESRPRALISDHHLHGGKGSNFFFQLARQPSLAQVPKCFLEVEFIDHPQVQGDFLDRRPESFRAVADAIAEFLVQEVTARK